MNTLALDLSSKTINLGLDLKGNERMIFSDNYTESNSDRLFFFCPISLIMQKLKLMILEE